MGDVNAKIGDVNTGYEQVMGIHGLGRMNENGELFTDFCAQNRLVIVGSVFEHRHIHKATWRSPDHVFTYGNLTVLLKILILLIYQNIKKYIMNANIVLLLNLVSAILLCDLLSQKSLAVSQNTVISLCIKCCSVHTVML